MKVRALESAATYDLFKILKAMAADPEVSDRDFRVAFRVAQAVNARTGWAEIGDERLMEEACVSDQQARRARRQLESAGWIETVRGRRNQATRYRFLETKREAIEARVKAAADARDDLRMVKDIERRAQLASAGLPINFEGESSSRWDEDGAALPFKIDHVSPSPVNPLLPHSSTSRDISTATVQDVAKGYDPATGEIPLTLEERGEARIIPTCDECDQPAVIRCEIFDGCYCRRHEWIATRPVEIGGQPPAPYNYRALSRGA